MDNISKRWNNAGLRYSFTLAIIMGLIMLGAKIFAVTDITWALVSGVVCTELETNKALSLVLWRIIATMIGVAVAFLILLVIGAGYIGLVVGVVITTLICHYSISSLKNNWKLVTATVVIVLVTGLQHNSASLVEAVALKRAIEVIAGSLAAGLVTGILEWLW
ncbi:YccC-like domain protein [Candidatus Trichorickettsia mobilis]|uniref:YccC-like domain protein n=1 Tax=Candidatus Trichorickettsia mobilis TaxID=1346319 RepID=A0ABZ0UUW7_9RICK|nr:FUSC family protein [Candidatus Trichorickettsia mobilis]WPY00427.1 YccC-like domain protein [Candidatus Trichorickettsia mobilis]